MSTSKRKRAAVATADAPAPAPTLYGRCSVCLGTVERRGGERVGGSCRCAAVTRPKPKAKG